MITIVPFAALLLLGAAGSWVGCIVPFAAIAACAGLRLRTRSGVALLLVVWALNQAVGFIVRRYPHDVSTYAWAVALLLASIVAYAAVRSVRMRPFVALLAAFGSFQLVLAAFSIALGGWNAYAPATLAYLLFWNALWFAVVQAAASVVLREPIAGAVL